MLAEIEVTFLRSHRIPSTMSCQSEAELELLWMYTLLLGLYSIFKTALKRQ